MAIIKKILFGVILGLLIIVLFGAYQLYQMSAFLEKKNGCGINGEPVYCKKVNIRLNSLKIDTYLKIPDGELAISNTYLIKNEADTIPPILLRLDKNRNIIWALKLDSKPRISGIPFYGLFNAKLKNDRNGKRISFFNSSYSEPGEIYLDNNYDFDYLCLKHF